MYTFLLLNTLLLACVCNGQLSSQTLDNYAQKSNYNAKLENGLFLNEEARHKRSDDIPALQVVVQGLSQQLSEVKAQLTSLETKCSGIESSSQQQYAQLKTKLETAETTVAFHAHHSTDPFSVASHGTIVYDAVTSNIGGAYDPKTGYFTAPVSGTYMLFINCMAVSSTSEEPSVLVEEKVVAACHSNMIGGSTSELGATLSVVHMNSGEQARVRMLENAENVRGYYWNTFAGFLVRADVAH